MTPATIDYARFLIRRAQVSGYPDGVKRLARYKESGRLWFPMHELVHRALLAHAAKAKAKTSAASTEATRALAASVGVAKGPDPAFADECKDIIAGLRRLAPTGKRAPRA